MAETQRLVMVDTGSGSTCRTFVFKNEGHTLGNALRAVILQNPEVIFCGYTLPHPAEDQMHLRIQTVAGANNFFKNYVKFFFMLQFQIFGFTIFFCRCRCSRRFVERTTRSKSCNCSYQKSFYSSSG